MLRYLNPLLWLRWAGQFLYAWTHSISWRDAPKAIPAILLMMVLTVIGVVAFSENSNWRTDLLNRQLQVAWDQEKYETAELVIMRQLRKRPDDAQLVYRLALTRHIQGQTENAAELMRDLTKVKAHEPSARWLLQKEFVGKEWDKLSQEGKDEFGRLLKLVYKEKPDDIAIKQLYADYLIASQRYPQAIPILDELSWIQPMRGLQAAALSRKLGNNSTAQRLAKRTLDAVDKMSEEDPTNSTLALAVAQNQLFLRLYDQAVRTLDRSIQRAKTEKERRHLSQAMGDAIVAWVSFIEESPSKESMKERLRILRMLQVALRYAPNNPRVLTLVADQVLATAEEDDQQIQAVREALINGSSIGIAHFIRGTAALMKDDIESATVSLKLAAEHMPQSGAILNNLAVALSLREDGNLEQALKISESAIKQTPNPTAHFFETRGQILFRLQRYFDAIPDLERALSVQTLAPQAHQSLATCYDKIGEEELAGLHREAAGLGETDVETSPETSETVTGS